MAKTYRLGPARRAVNRVVRLLLGTPFGPPHHVLLTVAGRRSGQPRSTPVRPVEYSGQRFLVSPYGPVGWVRNARVAGQVTLRRGGHQETVAVVEEDAAASGPVLRAYVRAVPVTRPFFDAGPDDPVDRFVAEAATHPVFRILTP